MSNPSLILTLYREGGGRRCLILALSCFFKEKLLRGGEIEIAVCEGGHTCVSVYACKC